MLDKVRSKDPARAEPRLRRFSRRPLSSPRRALLLRLRRRPNLRLRRPNLFSRLGPNNRRRIEPQDLWNLATA